MMTTQTIDRTTKEPTKRFNANKFRLVLDLIFLVAMLVTLSPAITGIPFHEWIGVLILVPLLIHLVSDWQWVVNTTRRIFKPQPGEVRFNYWINWIQFVLFMLATVSGIVISETVLPYLGLHMEIDRYWVAMHEISAGVFTLFLGVHIAMHWRWLVNMFQRYVLRRSKGEQYA